MVVRLQTEDGKIKEYKTVYGVGCTPVSLDYWDYAKWVTKCGKEWKKKPKPQDQCDHLECAIYIAETSMAMKRNMPHAAAKAAVLSAILLIIFRATSIFSVKIMEDILIFLLVISISMVFFTILTYFLEYGADKRLDELNEFKKNGTIKGIKASQIEAKAKHWWQFWR
jgi:hypothetical protein